LCVAPDSGGATLCIRKGGERPGYTPSQCKTRPRDESLGVYSTGRAASDCVASETTVGSCCRADPVLPRSDRARRVAGRQVTQKCRGDLARSRKPTTARIATRPASLVSSRCAPFCGRVGVPTAAVLDGGWQPLFIALSTDGDAPGQRRTCGRRPRRMTRRRARPQS
jgi:hypothetical protein